MKTLAEKMREYILKSIRAWVDNDSVELLPDGEYITCEEAIVIAEEHATGSKWISVKERLPENEGFYITNSTCGVDPLYFENKKWKDLTGDEIVIEESVTHWQSLPPAPSQQEGEG